LADASLIGEAHNEAIFPGVVLVPVLADHFASSFEVGLAFTATASLDLKAFEECNILQDFDERHDCGLCLGVECF